MPTTNCAQKMLAEIYSDCNFQCCNMRKLGKKQKFDGAKTEKAAPEPGTISSG